MRSAILYGNNRFFGDFVTKETAAEALRNGGWTYHDSNGLWSKQSSAGVVIFVMIVGYPEIKEAGELSNL